MAKQRRMPVKGDICLAEAGRGIPFLACQSAVLFVPPFAGGDDLLCKTVVRRVSNVPLLKEDLRVLFALYSGRRPAVCVDGRGG